MVLVLLKIKVKPYTGTNQACSQGNQDACKYFKFLGSPPLQSPSPSPFRLPPAIQELEQNMRYIEGGKFLVSSFEIGRYEVTQAQWQAVMGNNPSHFRNCGSGCPTVENVSWNEIQIFLKKTKQHDR